MYTHVYHDYFSDFIWEQTRDETSLDWERLCVWLNKKHKIIYSYSLWPFLSSLCVFASVCVGATFRWLFSALSHASNIEVQSLPSSPLHNRPQTTFWGEFWPLCYLLKWHLVFYFVSVLASDCWGGGYLCFVFQNNNNKYSDLRVVPSVCVLTTSSTGASVSSTFVPIFVAFFLLFLTLPTKLWLVECFSSWVEQQSTGLTESLKKSGMWAMIQ